MIQSQTFSDITDQVEVQKQTDQTEAQVEPKQSDQDSMTLAELEAKAENLREHLRLQREGVQREFKWGQTMQEERQLKINQRNELLLQKRNALQQFRPIKREYVDDYRHTCITLTGHNSKLAQVVDFVTKMVW